MTLEESVLHLLAASFGWHLYQVGGLEYGSHPRSVELSQNVSDRKVSQVHKRRVCLNMLVLRVYTFNIDLDTYYSLKVVIHLMLKEKITSKVPGWFILF